MAQYTPFPGDVIDYTAAGEYTPLAGDQIAFDNAIIDAFPQPGWGIHFRFEGQYEPYPGDTIPFGGEPIGPPPPPPEPIPRPLVPDFNIAWEEMARLNNLLGMGWQGRRFVTRSFITAHSELERKERKTNSEWLQKNGKDEKFRSSWKKLNHFEKKYRSSWYSKSVKDISDRIAWDNITVQLDFKNRIPYLYPPANERILLSQWDKQRHFDEFKDVPWINRLPIKDIDHRTTWGPKYYYEICYRKYRYPPGDQLNFDLNLRLTNVGDKDNIQFIFDQFTFDRRCNQRESSGWRDNYFYTKPGLIPRGLYSRVYVMHNTAFLTRFADGLPIDATEISLSTDWDSVYWSLNATIGSDASLALLEPTTEGPIAVTAGINGHTWKMQIDRTAAGHSFGQKRRTVTGRSISAQLGAPAAAIKTYTESQTRTAIQLIDQELANTGWTATMAAEDWLVPGDTLSYQDQTPMSVIKLLADACGAMVQSHMSSQSLLIKKRFAVPPWLWPATPAELIIPAAMATTLDREWDERPLYNAVFVSGGISAKVFRTGSAGDKLAPMVTDPLITATEAARQLGVYVLAGSGRWSKYKIELPVFTPPGVPGVILPGTLIQLVDGVLAWKGIVTAVSVHTGRAQGGKVRQTLDVERYHGN